jgi:hypothetical protein
MVPDILLSFGFLNRGFFVGSTVESLVIDDSISSIRFFCSSLFLYFLYYLPLRAQYDELFEYAAEYKRVCGTMGWRDYNVENLSAMETGDLRVVEVKMKQIIEEQDAIKMDKDEEKVRQIRLSNLRIP